MCANKALHRQLGFMSIDPSIVREIEALLIQECGLYRDYLAVLTEERGWFSRFNAEKVEGLTVKRAELYEAMLSCQNRRLELMRSISQNKSMNLRALISEYCIGADAKRILPYCEELRSLAAKIERESRQHSQIIHFGLKTVHGLLSILWSATQSVLKSYDRKGAACQSYQPVKSRLSGVLKRA